jgi:hypothetical protein
MDALHFRQVTSSKGTCTKKYHRTARNVTTVSWDGYQSRAGHFLPALGKVLKVQTLGLLAGLMTCGLAAPTTAEIAKFKLLKLGGNSVNWQNVTTGQPPVVSYAVIRETREFIGARNCRKLTALDGVASASELTEEVIRQEIGSAFAMWQAAAGIIFRQAETPMTADILIGAQVEPEGWAFTNVFYDTRSSDAVKRISQSLICLNPLKRWKVGFDGNLKSYDLRYTLAHEIGHAIGLDHPDDDGQIMSYRYEEAFRELQPGDVAGAVLMYGPHVPVAEAGLSRPAIHQSSLARMRAKRWGTRALAAAALGTQDIAAPAVQPANDNSLPPAPAGTGTTSAAQ